MFIIATNDDDDAALSLQEYVHLDDLHLEVDLDSRSFPGPCRSFKHGANLKSPRVSSSYMMKRPWRVPANGAAILISKMRRQENGQTATVGKCGGSLPPTR